MRRSALGPGNRTILVLSLTAALPMLVAPAAQAATITGGAVLSAGTTNLTWNGGGMLVINSGVLVNGTPAITASPTVGILLNNGTITGSNGVSNSGLITIFNNGDGTIAASINGATGIHNVSTGTINTLHNFSGSKISAITGVKNFGTISTLTNDIGGSIAGGASGIVNNTSGVIGTLSNSGRIDQAVFGINNNAGSITTLQNNVGGSINALTAILNNNGGSIGTLTNMGVITNTSRGIANFAGSTITSLNNGGSIAGQIGIDNNASIATLTNSGTIQGANYAIYNTGTIGVLANNGGVISGTIRNGAQGLTLTGGSGSTFGTLTGAGSGIGVGNIGLITISSSNLTFNAGNQLLNDHINAASNTVINTGSSTLQINNNITITGNYTQDAGATLNIGVADNAVTTGVVSADSGYGRLVITGLATFNAGTSITLKKLGSYAFAAGQRFVVVQASNANANFNTGLLNYSADGYTGTYTGTSVVDSGDNTKTDLVITLGSASTPGNNRPNIAATAPNAISALTGLFRYGGTDSAMLNMFNAAAALGSTAEANRAGAQLSPAANTVAAVQGAQAPTQAVLDITSAHVDTMRTAQAGGSGVATGERASDIALWGQAFGGQANQGNRYNASGYRAGYSGLLIGADTALNDQWRIGGVFNYADTSVNSGGDNTGSSAHIKSYGVTGYAGYTAERWYLNLSGGVVQQKYNTLRSISYTGFAGNASGQFNGTQYTASVLAGYPVRLDASTTLMPIAGVSYSRLNQDAYTETGSVAALRVNSASTSSIKSDLGARLERTIKTAYGNLTPSAQMSWRHEYRDTSIQSVANLAADSNGATVFTTQGATANRDTGVLVLGAMLARSQNLSVAARYTLEAARGYTAQTADVRLRYQF